MANPTQELEKPEVNSATDNVNNAPSTGMQTQGGTAVEQPTKQELQTPQGVERTRTGRAYPTLTST